MIQPARLSARRLVPLAVALCLAACGADNTLRGSIAQYRNLSFSSVSIYTTGQAESLVIEYLRGANTQVPARLTVDVAGAPNIKANKAAALAGDAFETNVHLLRIIPPTALEAADTANNGKSTDVFPEVTSGSLVLEAASVTAGQPVVGNFTLTFGPLTQSTPTGNEAIPTGNELYGTFRGLVVAK